MINFERENGRVIKKTYICDGQIEGTPCSAQETRSGQEQDHRPEGWESLRLDPNKGDDDVRYALLCNKCAGHMHSLLQQGAA